MILVKDKPLSWNYYIPLYLIFISLLLFATRDFGQAQQSAIGLSNIHKILSVPLALAYVLYYFMQKRKIRKIPCALTFYIIYIFLALVGSIMFSTWLGYSLYKLVEIITVLMVVIYLWDLSKKHTFALIDGFNLIIIFYKILLVLSILGIFIFPSLAIRPPSEFQDAYLPFQLFGSIVKINANSLGMIGAIVFYMSFTVLSERKEIIVSFFWLIISLVVVILAQSRTAVIALLLVIFLYIILNKKTGLLGKIFIISTLVGGFLLSLNMIIKYLERGYSIEHMEELSGRSMWWKYALKQFSDSDILHQFFGAGYGVASRNILTSLGHPDASTLHSDYIDSLVSTGYLGLTAFLLMIVCIVYIMIKNMRIIRKSTFLLQLAGVFLLLSMRSFTGPTIAIHNFFLILYLIIIATVVQQVKHEKSTRKIK